MTASHDYRMADLEAENAKLRADNNSLVRECQQFAAHLAEARKSLDALRAAPSALMVEAKNILAIIDAARARMDHAGIDLAHGNHVILDHEGAINRLRAALAASPSAQPVAVPDEVHAWASGVVQCDKTKSHVNESHGLRSRVAAWILSLPAAPQPATPAPDAELQRLLDEFRRINDDNGWASAQTRLLEALARKVGCE